ncbi:hypothetical protein BJV82DRAFT_506477 [Fennellomyces sp. T-0311]|nr:hypothetical protein BJV82DRAFT_506477 [Fennellomyces sp. T-0311]
MLQQRANNTNRTSSSSPRRPKTGNDNVVRAMSPEGRRYLKPVNGIQTKGFARSAQRRSSVLTLGSIERLQHFYAKRDLKVNKVGILGFKNEMARALKEEQEEDDDDDILPERQEPPPSWMNLDVETDLDVLLQQCFQDTQVMLHNWAMISEHSDSDASSDSEGGFHIGSLLHSVTRMLDSVRNYTFHRNSLTETSVKKLRVAGIQLLGVMKEMELRHQKGEGDDEGFIPYSKLQNERASIIEYLSIVEDYAFNPPHHIGCPPITFGPRVSALFNKDSSLKRRVDAPNWLDPDCFINDDIGMSELIAVSLLYF